jgi:hypothetical protein
MGESRAQPNASRKSGRAPRRLPLVPRSASIPETHVWPGAVLAVVAGAAAVLDRGLRGPFLALAAFAFAFAAWTWWARRRGSEVASPGWLLIDDEQIARIRPMSRTDPRAGTALARWGEPFGVSVLANMARSRALLAFTTPSATRFLALELVTAKDADLARDLLERAVTVPDADLDAPIGPAPDVLLGAAAARGLLEELIARGPEALRRLYLSDARGGAIAVEQDSVVIGDTTIDLALPVEWRVFSFQEGEPGVAALYQATSIRQGTFEAVLVCRAPEELASWNEGRGMSPAPPRETRVAIDRLFMTPLRAVLEQAPRLSRPGSPPSRDRDRSAQT